MPRVTFESQMSRDKKMKRVLWVKYAPKNSMVVFPVGESPDTLTVEVFSGSVREVTHQNKVYILQVKPL